MRFLLLFLLATGATASMSLNQQSSGVQETGSVEYKGVHLRIFKLDDDSEILEPYIALQAGDRARVMKTDVGKGFYFTLPLIVDSSIDASRGGKKLDVMRVTSVSVSLSKSLTGECGKDCGKVSVTSVRKQDRGLSLIFRCLSRSTCKRIFNAFRFKTARSEFMRSALKFTFNGLSGSRTLQLTKAWLPIKNALLRPFPHSLWFEGDKLLLFTIKAGAGESAHDSFMSDHRYSIPRDGSLPDVYRSGLLDRLQAVLATWGGQWEMVAEMRVGDDRVAQVVFDVSKDRESVDKTNWFSPSRLKSSYPFWIGRSGFNFFGVAGDMPNHRHFFINKIYGGCSGDDGFWVVADHRDGCAWANGGFKGRLPALSYNRFPGKYQDRGVAFADRFFVYLRHATRPHTRGSPRQLPSSFVFEENKILLFTIKAGIGRDAMHTFLSKQTFPIPADRSLPDVFRSDYLDSLSEAVIQSGKQFMVAEMRVANKAVAQVVFDVTINRHALNSESWFSADRIVSSKPYFIGATSFNFFSVRGHDTARRNFFVSFRYGGCDGDVALWVVADSRDGCSWSNKFWTGSAPALVYNTVYNAPTVRHAARADNFLVYLM